MTDFRALCAELLTWAEKTSAHYYAPPEVLVRAKSALTEQSVVPSEEELNTLWNCCGTADEHGHHEGDIFEFARAVLVRWGRPADALPIPEQKGADA